MKQFSCSLTHEESENHRLSKNTSANIKILTWNVWAIPFAPRTFSNPHRCSKFLLDIGTNEDNWKDFDGLILCGFQELWAWKIGLFPSFILTFFVYYIEYIPYQIGRIISALFQIISLLIGLILKCLPIYYCPKQRVHQTLKDILPFAYYHKRIPFCRIMDNGLLMLSNKKTTEFGSEAYVTKACTDSMTNKGFIWTYFEEYSLLAINTHLQYSKSGKDTFGQINELKSFIHNFVERKNMDSMRIIVFGDFNVDLTNFEPNMKGCDKRMSLMCECDIGQKLGCGMKKINSYNPTMITEKWGCLDHIFVNFEIHNAKENMYPKLSDHLLILNSFVTN